MRRRTCAAPCIIVTPATTARRQRRSDTTITTTTTSEYSALTAYIHICYIQRLVATFQSPEYNGSDTEEDENLQEHKTARSQ
ncbi:hypothetical protein K466DRAFT_134475 [Polyporus arcularius HHB13444]|uniref:Uncharacterized protein n=1 Tax=Polyporus arcularius HHB13444 TaxID=1314778 RepID=A0A5C3PAX4_9APHY|nr:hypothetical protein K466DRAFT_134475 [Polyporus arcularius HHB13444]